MGNDHPSSRASQGLGGQTPESVGNIASSCCNAGLWAPDAAYDVDACFYDEVNSDRQGVVDFYQQALKELATDVLDLACGTGAISVALAEAGIRVVGVDCSTKMIDQALRRRRMRSLSEGQVSFVVADMRNVSIGQLFDSCICTYNSFQHLLTLEEQFACLQAVRCHLKPGGSFFFDVFNPYFDFLKSQRTNVFKIEFFSHCRGARIALHEDTHYNRKTQVTTIVYRYSYVEGPQSGQEILSVRFHMRQFFPEELNLLLVSQGFHIVEKFGSFDGAPFESDSPQQIILCRPD
jgi:ubiquinone/menaquinone biosynthesis C-methylase UbiE